MEEILQDFRKPSVPICTVIPQHIVGDAQNWCKLSVQDMDSKGDVRNPSAFIVKASHLKRSICQCCSSCKRQPRQLEERSGFLSFSCMQSFAQALSSFPAPQQPRLEFGVSKCTGAEGCVRPATCTRVEGHIDFLCDQRDIHTCGDMFRGTLRHVQVA